MGSLSDLFLLMHGDLKVDGVPVESYELEGHVIFKVRTVIHTADRQSGYLPYDVGSSSWEA